MGTRLYVSNLAWGTTEDGLRWAFESNGNRLDDAIIIRDADGARSRGFGFVEIHDPLAAAAAIRAMDGAELDGRPIKVALANPRPARRAA